MLDNDAEISPYTGVSQEDWEETTRTLVAQHPLKRDEIVEMVLKAWDGIFESRFGSRPFAIGTHIFPKPQIMAFLLHELIPLELNAKYSETWRGDESANEKDLVYVPDDRYSIELKTSSSANGIFGNRSYAQPGTNPKKSKSGYLLAVNFEKFLLHTVTPRIRRIRFGWLDHEDWFGQAAATGQQARLSKEAQRYKLEVLYE